MSYEQKHKFFEDKEVTEFGIQFFDLFVHVLSVELKQFGYTPETGISFIEWCLIDWKKCIRACFPKNASTRLKDSKIARLKMQLIEYETWKWFCGNYIDKVNLVWLRMKQ